MKILTFFVVYVLIWKGAELTEDLHILVMAPGSESDDPAWNAARSLIPAARLAVDQINQRSDLLQGYYLKMVERESGCRFTSNTLINFIEAEFYNSSGKGVVGMVGPACSESVMATAHQINQSVLNFMQISVSSSPAVNGSSYINSFRTVPPVSVYVEAYDSLMKAAEWKKVGIVYDNQNSIYDGVFSELKRRIDSEQIFPVELNAKADHMYVFRRADEKNIRILLILTGLRIGQKILCGKSSYADFQLIFIDHTQEDLLQFDLFASEESSRCSPDELETALNNTIFIINRFRRRDTTSNDTFSGISYKTYEELYHMYSDDYVKEKNLENSVHSHSPASRYSNAYYDAVWALAIALNNSEAKFNLTEYASHHTEQQRKTAMGMLVRNSLKKEVHFEGMSGFIRFDSTTRALPGLGVILNQTIVKRTDRKYQFNSVTFIDKSQELNRTFTYLPYSLKTSAYSIDKRIAFTVLAAAALAVIFFAILQIALLSLKMKSSSPQLDYLVLSGCCLYFTVLLFYTIQTVFPNRLRNYELILGVGCNLQIWCFSVAFTLIFGTVCAKTWRIYRIFKYFKQGRIKYVSDPFLISAIISLVLLDVIYLVAWTLSDPWMLGKREKREGQQIVRYQFCSCNHVASWSTGLLIQKLILIFFAVALSILVRPVKRRGFKNTKSILVLIYALLIIHVIGISLYTLLEVLQTLNILSYLGYALTFTLTLIIITLSQFLTQLWPPMKRRMNSRVHRRAALWTMLVDSTQIIHWDSKTLS